MNEPEAAAALNATIAAIGPKIQALRKERGFSLQELANRSGVSVAAIHKLERGGMVPTVATLMKLATAFNRSVGYFVNEDEADRDAVLIRPAGRRDVYTSKDGLRLDGISGPYGPFRMAGAVAEVEPGANSGPRPMEHPGEELVYLLEGRLRFTVEDETYLLRPKDTLHFRANRRHTWANPLDRPARALWMVVRST